MTIEQRIKSIESALEKMGMLQCVYCKEWISSQYWQIPPCTISEDGCHHCLWSQCFADNAELEEKKQSGNT